MCEKCKRIDEKYTKAPSEEVYYDNEDLTNIEEDDYYIGMQEETQLELKNQRDELVLAGVIWTVYNTLSSFLLEAIKNGEASKEDITKLQTYIAGQAEKKINPINIDFIGTFQNYLVNVGKVGGQSILDSLGIKETFSIKSQTLTKIIQERISSLAKGLTEFTSKNFARNVVLGLQEGMSAKKLTKRMLALGTELSEQRAKRILVTETNAALQFMRRETAKKLGADTKTWRTSETEKTCQFCNGLNGVTVPMSKDFSGYEIPPAHPHCKCFIEYGFSNLGEDVYREGL